MIKKGSNVALQAVSISFMSSTCQNSDAILKKFNCQNFDN